MSISLKSLDAECLQGFLSKWANKCARDKLNVNKQLEQTKNSLQVILIIVAVVVVCLYEDIAMMSLLNVQCSL